jgi:hypothetical protein
MKPLRRLLHVALFLVGLFGTSVWLCSVDEVPFFSWVRSKLTHVEEHGGDYDTLFLGSSRMQYGVAPKLFDRRMAELGKPWKSFNFALPGLRQHDVDVMVRWLVAHKPSSLRRVVVELHTFHQSVRAGDWLSNQEIDMHQLGQFVPRCRSILTCKSPWNDKLAQFQFVFVHTLVNTLRIGQGQRILDDKLRRAKGQRIADAYDIADAGADFVERLNLPHVLRDHQTFVDQPEIFTKTIQQKIVDVAPQWIRGGFNLPSIRAQAELLRAAGIESFYVVMPTLYMDFPGREGVTEFARDHHVLELDLPHLHRPLYEREQFYDASHLTRAGIAVFSPHLADQLAALDALPPGQRLAPQVLSARPLGLRVERVEGAAMLQCVAENLPFVGKVVVGASLQSGDITLANGVRLGVAQPPTWSAELVRDGVASATGTLPLGAALPMAPVFVQMTILQDGVTIATSEVLQVALQ